MQTSAALTLYVFVTVVSSSHTDGLLLQCTVQLDYLYVCTFHSVVGSILIFNGMVHLHCGM